MTAEIALEQVLNLSADPQGPLALRVDFAVNAAVACEIDVSIDIHRVSDDALVYRRQLRQDGWDPSWLPRGLYSCHALAPRLDLPPGEYRAHIALWHGRRAQAIKAAEAVIELRAASGEGQGPKLAWQLEGRGKTTQIDELSWRLGAGDWFYKHFDHAARTVASYFLGDSPLLTGRVLDVGCGDGITDLGLALRWQPESFIGVDPFRGYERLPQILDGARMPRDAVPENLKFMPADANDLPFEDNHFDVVVSWGSLEHIVGGYAKALAEIRRVLKPDGLAFLHPGLFYSDVGNHLGEFAFARAEPYVHLKRSREQLREMVLAATPDYIDRSGEFSTPEQYWQWFTELNPITVDAFEREIRALGFEPWRVALRTHERVDYTRELQRYSFVDLAVGELYLSAYNRK